MINAVWFLIIFNISRIKFGVFRDDKNLDFIAFLWYYDFIYQLLFNYAIIFLILNKIVIFYRFVARD